jgi:hypothetical protein
MEESQKSGSEKTVVGKRTPDEGAEVSGRGKSFLYTCYNCGAGNYVDPKFASTFSCWRCGGHSEHSDP